MPGPQKLNLLGFYVAVLGNITIFKPPKPQFKPPKPQFKPPKPQIKKFKPPKPQFKPPKPLSALSCYVAYIHHIQKTSFSIETYQI